jgi:hypothetical protein
LPSHVIKLGTDASLFFLPGEEKKKLDSIPCNLDCVVYYLSDGKSKPNVRTT